MTNDELDRSLRQLRLGGMADALTIRSQQARAESLRLIDFISLLVRDELQRRRDRLIDPRIKAASFRDQRTLDSFDWKFKALDRALTFELANGRFIEQHEGALVDSRVRFDSIPIFEVVKAYSSICIADIATIVPYA